MISYEFAEEVTRFKKAYSEIFKTEPHFVVDIGERISVSVVGAAGSVVGIGSNFQDAVVDLGVAMIHVSRTVKP
jgi:hypothetical protein